MPMTQGEKILINWMAETRTGIVRHGPQLSEAIDPALEAKDVQIIALTKALVASEISNVLSTNIVGECKK